MTMPPGPFSPAAVERICRVLAEAVTGPELEASKSVADKLRTKTGENGDGSPLVDATCSLKSGPRIAFNNLGTEWQRSEQTGIAMLMKGLFSTFRNPTAHAPKVLWATSRSEALDMLTLTSMLHRRLDDAVVRYGS